MDEDYDAIVLGTGLKECVISGLLSTAGKKVLHIDRNDFYGGEGASLNLTQLFKEFDREGKEPKDWGPNREWNVDLIPKFLMADGNLVKLLLYTGVSRYLEFRSVDGSYVFKNDKKGGKINKVPATDGEALKSSLMGLREKFRARKFFIYVQDYVQEDESTHQGLDCSVVPMKDVFAKFGLEEDTKDFVGHALALWTDEGYLDRPALETMKRMGLYAQSLARYTKSPYLYPRYGLGELPQAFSRLCAIHGGTYMLRQNPDEIVYEDGRVVGVKSEGQTAHCSLVVGDPSYFPDKAKEVGKVIRVICVLNHPVPGTANVDSVQIIIPAKQVNMKKDIYISSLASSHNVCGSGKYIAIVSKEIEDESAGESAMLSEVEPGLKLVGEVEDKFVRISTIYEPTDLGSESKVYISKSFDATSHFETTSSDILEIYERIMGEPLDLKIQKTIEDEQNEMM